jgi:GNAT superfamily N-acetyltransferase
MSRYEVIQATRAEESLVAYLMTLAFGSDPVARWVWPDPKVYTREFPEFTRLYGGKAFDHGGTHADMDRRSAAMWLPPEVHPDDEALTACIERTVPQDHRNAVFDFFERMGSHHPGEPHWFLPLIGVDPLYQGQGRGSALLSHALSICDREQQLAYLDSSNPKNVPLYQRHGFKLVGEVRVGQGPTSYAMLRRPHKVERK